MPDLGPLIAWNDGQELIEYVSFLVSIWSVY